MASLSAQTVAILLIFPDLAKITKPPALTFFEGASHEHHGSTGPFSRTGEPGGTPSALVVVSDPGLRRDSGGNSGNHLLGCCHTGNRRHFRHVSAVGRRHAPGERH